MHTETKFVKVLNFSWTEEKDTFTGSLDNVTVRYSALDVSDIKEWVKAGEESKLAELVAVANDKIRHHEASTYFRTQGVKVLKGTMKREDYDDMSYTHNWNRIETAKATTMEKLEKAIDKLSPEQVEQLKKLLNGQKQD